MTDQESMFELGGEAIIEEELEANEPEQAEDDVTRQDGKGMEAVATLDEIRGAIDEDDKGKFDIVCRMGELTFHAEPHLGKRGEMANRCWLSVDSDIAQRFDTMEFDTEHKALRQLSQMAKVPFDFLVKHSPSRLAEHNMSTMMGAQSDRPVLLRCRRPGTGPGSKKDNPHPYVRGFLNASYGVFDNHRMFDMAKPRIEALGLQAQQVRITDHGLHLRFIDPTRSLDIGRPNIGENTPDGVTFGVHVANSETGHRAATGDFLIYRMVCSNGMVSMVDGARLFEIFHSRIDDDVIRNSVESGFGKLRNNFDHVMHQFGQLKLRELEDPKTEMLDVMKIFRVKPKYRQLVLDVMEQEFAQEPWYNTAFTVVNTLTSASQRISNANDRLGMDIAAGKAMNRYRLTAVA